MTILTIQHVGCEPMGLLEDILNEQGLQYRNLHPYLGDPIPQTHFGIDCLILMGGPMNVYEHTAYPWLLDEDILIRNCLEERVPILGICLGSQLLAKAANSEVKVGHAKEIGWRPVRLEPAAHADPVFAGMEKEFSVFHWHGDTFDLPDGATLLASSEMYVNQAFSLNQNCYAFQFHVEVTESMIQEWCAAYPGDVETMHYSEASIPVGCVECRDRIAPLHEKARRIFLNYFRHIHLI